MALFFFRCIYSHVNKLIFESQISLDFPVVRTRPCNQMAHRKAKRWRLKKIWILKFLNCTKLRSKFNSDPLQYMGLIIQYKSIHYRLKKENAEVWKKISLTYRGKLLNKMLWYSFITKFWQTLKVNKDCSSTCIVVLPKICLLNMFMCVKHFIISS